MFILWCSEEVSAIRIAYLIARCNDQDICLSVVVLTLVLLGIGGWCDISIYRKCGVSTKRFKEGDSVFGM